MKVIKEDWDNEEILLEDLLTEARGQTELKQVVCSIVSALEHVNLDSSKCIIHHIKKDHTNMNYTNIALIAPNDISYQKAHGSFHRKNNSIDIENDAPYIKDYNFVVYFLQDYINEGSNKLGPKYYKV